MKKGNLYLLFSLFLVFPCLSQIEMVLKRGLKHAVLSKGLRLMPIFKNDTNTYSGWKNACAVCSSFQADSTWEIDDITKDSVICLKKIASYQYDTVSNAQYRKLSRAKRKLYNLTWKEDTVIHNSADPSASFTVYKKPGTWSKLNVRYDQLRALRFARTSNCPDDGKKPYYLVSGLGIAGFGLQCYGFATAPVTYQTYIGFAASASLTIIALHSLNKLKVKTYELSGWKMKVKKMKRIR